MVRQAGSGRALFNGMTTAVGRVLAADPGSEELQQAQVPCMLGAGTYLRAPGVCRRMCFDALDVKLTCQTACTAAPGGTTSFVCSL